MPPDDITSPQSAGTTYWSSASDEEILNVDLLIALGLETLSDEDKAQLINQMTSTVQKGVVMRILDSLDASKQDEMQAVLDAGDPEKINQFLTTEVPNFPDLVNQETIKFKRAMLTEATAS